MMLRDGSWVVGTRSISWLAFFGSVGVLVFACDSEVTQSSSGDAAGGNGQGGSSQGGTNAAEGGSNQNGGTGGNTGGNTNGICAPESGDSQCFSCVKEECCNELTACNEDPICQCVSECVPSAPGMGMQKFEYCTEECDGDPGNLWTSLRMCRQQECSEDCMGG